MENLSKSYFHHQRRFDLAPQVGVIGYVGNKKDVVSRSFESYNYSFIMNGTGTYRYKGVDYPVESPCVITQWPGDLMHYGSDTSWDEIYFIYPGECGDKLKASGLFVEDRFMWWIHEPFEITKMLDELKELCQMPVEAGTVDRIDILCSKIIIDTLSVKKHDSTNSQERLIHNVAEKFRKNPEKLFDFEDVARENDISLSTFRRLWLKYQKVPPARFLADLKVDAACHLLNGTALSINEIADKLNFSDPLYFSRFFRHKTGFSATEYRNLNNPR